MNSIEWLRWKIWIQREHVAKTSNKENEDHTLFNLNSRYPCTSPPLHGHASTSVAVSLKAHARMYSSYNQDRDSAHMTPAHARTVALPFHPSSPLPRTQGSSKQSTSSTLGTRLSIISSPRRHNEHSPSSVVPVHAGPT